MTLYLIRHAQADERGAKYPDDSQRPLVEKGHKQAKALAKALDVLDVELDRLFSSPYTRALETAKPLVKRAKTEEVETLSELITPRYPQLLVQLVDNLERSDTSSAASSDASSDTSVTNGISGDFCVALVGHEPYLSKLTSYLLTGDETRVNFKFKKGMVVQLGGALSAGGMTLHMILPASLYRRL